MSVDSLACRQPASATGARATASDERARGADDGRPPEASRRSVAVSGEGADDRVRRAADRRGQSEVLGFVLIFGVMIAGALIVVGLGATALDDSEEELSGDRAEKALTQFDSKAGLVALGEADSQRLTFAAGGDGQYSLDGEAGWMNITFENRTTGDVQEVMNVTLGAMHYEDDRTKLAYQGGGVWRASETGGQMVSPPEFHYRNGTLTLPTVKVSGDAALGKTVDVTQAGEYRTFPDESKGDEWKNPLDNHKVNLTVGSEFYQGWGHYFEERTDGDVIYHDEKERVTLELVVPADSPPVQGGLITGTSEELVVKNNAQMDSFDSESGTYSETSGSNTRIIGSGDLNIAQNSKVWGNVEIDGDVWFENNAELEDGNISYGGTVGGPGWDEGWIHEDHHWVEDGAEVKSPDSVELLIEERLDDLESENDNDEASDISANSLGDCSSTCTLEAGEYYLDGMDLDGELDLDTSDGVIELAVDGDVNFQNNAIANVTGDDRVNVWVRDDATFNEDSAVTEPFDNSTKFWFYMNPDRTASLRNNVQFTGVIYGPGNLEPGVEIILKQNAQVFGGAIGEVDFAANNVWIHYDEALATTQSLTHETSVVTITFLHITVNEISVENP